jgi:hypothetical protein
MLILSFGALKLNSDDSTTPACHKVVQFGITNNQLELLTHEVYEKLEACMCFLCFCFRLNMMMLDVSASVPL